MITKKLTYQEITFCTLENKDSIPTLSTPKKYSHFGRKIDKAKALKILQAEPVEGMENAVVIDIKEIEKTFQMSEHAFINYATEVAEPAQQ